MTDITAPLPAPQPINLPLANPDLLTRFFPREIIEQKHSGEFRQVINVFVGLEGDPTEAQLTQLMHALFTLQAKYGGLLNRLDFGDKGCNLLLFWGAPVSYENDVARALNFLLELHDHSPVSLRTGVTSHIAHAGFIGSALHEEYTCYGNGVNLAVRLMTATPWKSIWVDEQVNLKAEQQFDLEFEGAHFFKGFAEEQAVYALRGYKADTGLDFYERQMIGRAGELRQLAAFVKPLWSAESPKRFAGILVVTGDAGIGKSRLVYEFQNHWTELTDAPEVTPVWFLCQTDQIMRQSLNPFRYWLRNYFQLTLSQSDAHKKQSFDQQLNALIQATPDETLQRELERTRSFLGALVDLHWEDSLYVRLDPQSRYENTLSALKTLLIAESLRQPVILQVEDLHWLDVDSIEFVKWLVRNIEPYPLAILATARPEVKTFFDAKVTYETLALTGLARAELATLAVNILENTPAPRLLDLLEERAGGNPFFAEQMLFYLQAENLLEVGVDGVSVREAVLRASPLPSDVRTLFIARLDRLAQEVKEIVQTAAVLGREFEVQVLSQMLETAGQFSEPTLRVVEHVRVAEETAIWTALTEMRYLFKHVLLRDAAYEMQVRTRQAALHQLAAEALEALYAQELTAHYAEIAYHYEAAYLAGLESLATQARAYLKKAGTQAASRFENTTAVDYFSRALRLTPESDLGGRYDLLLAREAVYDNRGNRAPQMQDIIALEEVAEALNDNLRRAEVALRRANYGVQTSDFDMAIAAASRAIALAQAKGDAALEAQGHYQWGEALRRQGNFMDARVRCERALALAQDANLARAEADARSTLGFVALRLGEWAEAEHQTMQALLLYRERGDLVGEMVCANVMGIVRHDQYDYAGALALFEQALGLARQTGRRLREANYLNNLGNASKGLGAWAKSQAYYEQSLRLCQEIGHRDGEAFVFTNVGELTIRVGDLGRGRGLLEQGAAIAREVGNRAEESAALAHLSLYYIHLGEYEIAREQCLEALRIARDLGSRSYEGPPLIVLAHALAGLGRLDEAQQYYREAVEVREALDQTAEALEARGGLARVALARGDTPTALAEMRPIAEHLWPNLAADARTDHGLVGAQDPLWVWITWYQVLDATGDPRAMDVLARAYAILQAEMARLKDPKAQWMYVENIPYRREIIAAYKHLMG